MDNEWRLLFLLVLLHAKLLQCFEHDISNAMRGHTLDQRRQKSLINPNKPLFANGFGNTIDNTSEAISAMSMHNKTCFHQVQRVKDELAHY